MVDGISLEGSLKSYPLPTLIRFLAQLRATGTLGVYHASYLGELSLNSGRVVSASFGSERGRPALEAIALAPGRGQFRFNGGRLARGSTSVDTLGDVAAQWASLELERATIASVIPSLTAVPRLVPEEAQTRAGEPVEVTHHMIQLLRAVDGRRSVAELGSANGTARTLRVLACLVEMDLVRVAVTGEPANQPALPAPRPSETALPVPCPTETALPVPRPRQTAARRAPTRRAQRSPRPQSASGRPARSFVQPVMPVDQVPRRSRRSGSGRLVAAIATVAILAVLSVGIFHPFAVTPTDSSVPASTSSTPTPIGLAAPTIEPTLPPSLATPAAVLTRVALLNTQRGSASSP